MLLTTLPPGSLRRPGRPAFVAWVLAWALACLAAAPAVAQGAAADRGGPLVREWAVLAGVFDVGTGDGVAEVGGEARFRLFRLPLGSFELPIEPAAGAMVNADSGGYAYGGFRIPLQEIWPEVFPPRLRVLPFTGVGVYEAGDGKDLGGPVEFRSGIEVSYRAGERWWLGLSLYHLSNAVLYDTNPGEESLLLTLSWR